jgi:hypothetical protein
MPDHQQSLQELGKQIQTVSLQQTTANTDRHVYKNNKTIPDLDQKSIRMKKTDQLYHKSIRIKKVVQIRPGSIPASVNLYPSRCPIPCCPILALPSTGGLHGWCEVCVQTSTIPWCTMVYYDAPMGGMYTNLMRIVSRAYTNP